MAAFEANPLQPWPQRRVGALARQEVEQLQEGVLGDVLGGGIAEHAQGEVVDRPCMQLVQLRERGFVTAACTLQQFAFLEGIGRGRAH